MPTVTFGNNTGNTAGIDDNRMPENDPTTNFGSDAVIANSDFGAGDHQSMWLKCTGFGSISGPVTVSSATLRLYLETQISTPLISLYRCLRNVTEGGSTFNLYDGTNAWGTGGGGNSTTDYNSTLITSATLPGTTGAYVDFTGANLNQLVQDWINGSVSNFGLIAPPLVIGGNDMGIFTSSEGTDGQRPELVVTYAAASSAPKTLLLLGVG